MPLYVLGLGGMARCTPELFEPAFGQWFLWPLPAPSCFSSHWYHTSSATPALHGLLRRILNASPALSFGDSGFQEAQFLMRDLTAGVFFIENIDSTLSREPP
jgi:hypothetical protein